MTPSLPRPHAHNILLVEDDTGTREAMEVLLTTHGCGVVSARSAGAALPLLRSKPRPCVILLDLMMSDVSGDEFRHAQLADPTARDIPVILISGAHDLASRAEALNAAAYLRKPLDIEALLIAIAHNCVAETAVA